MSRAAALKTAAMFLALAAVVELWPADPLDAQERSEAIGPPGGFAWTVAGTPGSPRRWARVRRGHGRRPAVVGRRR